MGHKKITRRTTGARGYKFELFQGIFLNISNNLLSLSSIIQYLALPQFISVHLGASRSILVYLGLSRCILLYLVVSQSISVYIGLSRSILNYLGLSWTISSYLGLSWTISVYLGPSRTISVHLNQVSLVSLCAKFQLSSWSRSAWKVYGGGVGVWYLPIIESISWSRPWDLRMTKSFFIPCSFLELTWS